MVRYAVPIVLACVYVIGATAIVRNEGRSYRDTLHRASPGTTSADAPPVVPEARVATAGDTVAKPETTVSRPEARPSEPTRARDVRVEPRVTDEAGPPSPVTAQPAPPSSTTVALKTAPGTTAAALSREDVAKITQWRTDPFWSRPERTKSWDPSRLTLDGERQIGEQLNRLILELNPADPGSGRERVVKAARPLLKLIPSSQERRDYQFFVLDSEVANAFSHPGGYIYVSRKLLEMIPEEDEGALQFVLAHEIAHVELHHALACLNAKDVRQFTDGTLPKLYFLIIPHGFAEAFEYRADGWAYTRLRELRRSEHDCRKFLRLLDSYAKAHGFGNGHGKVEDLVKDSRRDRKGGPAFSPIENHLRSHPAAYERLDRLKEFRAAAGP